MIENKGDLISRGALKKALNSNCDTLCPDKNTNWCEHCCPHNDFEDLIDNAPTVELFCSYLSDGEVREYCVEGPCKHERPQGEWIPVSERLPSYSGLYLISCDNLVTVANFTGDYFMSKGGNRIKVNAWQPLPEPYKEAEDEDS